MVIMSREQALEELLRVEREYTRLAEERKNLRRIVLGVTAEAVMPKKKTPRGNAKEAIGALLRTNGPLSVEEAAVKTGLPFNVARGAMGYLCHLHLARRNDDGRYDLIVHADGLA